MRARFWCLVLIIPCIIACQPKNDTPIATQAGYVTETVTLTPRFAATFISSHALNRCHSTSGAGFDWPAADSSAGAIAVGYDVELGNTCDGGVSRGRQITDYAAERFRGLVAFDLSGLTDSASTTHPVVVDDATLGFQRKAGTQNQSGNGCVEGLYEVDYSLPTGKSRSFGVVSLEDTIVPGPRITAMGPITTDVSATVRASVSDGYTAAAPMEKFLIAPEPEDAVLQTDHNAQCVNEYENLTLTITREYWNDGSLPVGTP